MKKRTIKLGLSNKELEICETLGLLKDTISEEIGNRLNYENLSFSKKDVRKFIFDLQTLNE